MTPARERFSFENCKTVLNVIPVVMGLAISLVKTRARLKWLTREGSKTRAARIDYLRRDEARLSKLFPLQILVLLRELNLLEKFDELRGTLASPEQPKSS